MYKKFAAAACAVVLMGLGTGGALAGEVTGPPGSVDNPPTKATGAPSHSTSNCSFNGLNDFNQGPTDNKVQTPHTQGLPGQAGVGNNGSGIPGQPNCGKDTNPRG
jgi:hypothetical protein